MAAEAWRQEKGIWHRGTPGELLAVSGVVALVGGGGKTGLMYCLAAEARDRGLRAAAMTTTRIWAPQAYCADADSCAQVWQAGDYAVCGCAAPQPGKLMAPGDELYRFLLEQSDLLLVEADGARGMPCKAPAEHEPVLPDECGRVVAVMGMDALGRPVEETCFRPELVCRLLGCGGEHRLTEDDMARILLNEEGSRKHVGGRAYSIVLNKCDNDVLLERGKAVAAALERRGHRDTVLTRLR